MINVEEWSLKPYGSSPHRYWVHGTVLNVSGKRLSGIVVAFDVLGKGGRVLGTTGVQTQLTILLPGQETSFTGPIAVENARMSEVALRGVTVTAADDVPVMKRVSFSSTKKSILLSTVRRPVAAKRR